MKLKPNRNPTPSIFVKIELFCNPNTSHFERLQNLQARYVHGNVSCMIANFRKRFFFEFANRMPSSLWWIMILIVTRVISVTSNLEKRMHVALWIDKIFYSCRVYSNSSHFRFRPWNLWQRFEVANITVGHWWRSSDRPRKSLDVASNGGHSWRCEGGKFEAEWSFLYIYLVMARGKRIRTRLEVQKDWFFSLTQLKRHINFNVAVCTHWVFISFSVVNN